MPQPRHAAAEFGEELRGLRREDGARLEQLLWLLDNQRRKLPDDPETVSAHNYALVLAGRAEAARAEALHLHRLLTPESRSQDLLHTVVALIDAGLCLPAQQRIDELRRRGLSSVESERLQAYATTLAARFGEVAWYRQRFSPTPVITLIERTGDLRFWLAQQQGIEQAIGLRVADMTCKALVDPEGAGARVCLDYFTDAGTVAEVEALLNAAVDAAMAAYADHPDGPGAFVGRVVIEVHGPEIPFRELQR